MTALLLRPFAALALTLLALAAGAESASAQQIVVMVNGAPITTYDVSQRQRLHQLIDRKSISSKEALDDLIDENIKVQQAKRLGAALDEDDTNRLYASVAERSGRTPQELTASLAQSGLDARTFKNKLAADYLWNQYVRARAGTVNVREADVMAALQKRGATQMVATEYTLRPIIFVVPRKANNYGARLQEANALRSRFTDCDSGIATAMGMKEVVVRPPVLRMSSDMPDALRKILDKTEIGRLTQPEVTQSGVETFAICGKREVRGDSAEKREIKDELSTAQFNKESKKLIEELRRGALIQYR